MQSEVAVVGAGASGLIAAYLLAEKGYKVKVFYKGYGATALSSGCFDILGYVDDGKTLVVNPVDGFDKLPERHPYRVISKNKKDLFKRALEDSTRKLDWMFRDFLYGTPHENNLYITNAGTLKPTAFVQKTMKGAKIEEGGEYTLVGIRGNYDFHPPLIANMLKIYLRAHGYREVKINTYTIRWKDITNALTPSFYIPEILVESKLRKTLSKIAREAKGTILIPPLLRRFEKAVEILEEFEGQVSEVPSTHMYAAGMRLMDKLISIAMNNPAIELIHVDRLKVEPSNMIITFSSKGRTSSEKFEKIVLATGDLVGGGMEIKDDYIVDTATMRKIRRLEKDKIPESYFDKNDMLSKLGYSVNEKLQPINDEGEVIWENIHVVGSLLGGYESNVEKAGLGVPMLTAYNLSEVL